MRPHPDRGHNPRRPAATRPLYRSGGIALLLMATLTPAPARAQGVFEVFRRAAQGLVGGRAVQVVEFRADVAIAVDGGPDAGDPELADPEIAQWLQQARPSLRAELHLIRTTCNLTDGEAQRLGRLGLKAVKTSLRDLLAEQRKGRQNNVMYLRDPRDIVANALLGVVTAELSAERAARYKAEVEARVAEQRTVTVRALVAILDEELYLTSEQRTELEEVLTAKWDAKWLPSLEHLQYARQYFPNIPATVLAPHLNPGQQKAFAAMQKNQGIMFGFGGGAFGDNDGLEPDPLEDSAVQAAIRGAVMGAIGVCRPAAAAAPAGVQKGAVMRAIRVMPAR